MSETQVAYLMQGFVILMLISFPLGLGAGIATMYWEVRPARVIASTFGAFSLLGVITAAVMFSLSAWAGVPR